MCVRARVYGRWHVGPVCIVHTRACGVAVRRRVLCVHVGRCCACLPLRPPPPAYTPVREPRPSPAPAAPWGALGLQPCRLVAGSWPCRRLWPGPPPQLAPKLGGAPLCTLTPTLKTKEGAGGPARELCRRGRCPDEAGPDLAPRLPLRLGSPQCARDSLHSRTATGSIWPARSVTLCHGPPCQARGCPPGPPPTPKEGILGVATGAQEVEAGEG